VGANISYKNGKVKKCQQIKAIQWVVVVIVSALSAVLKQHIKEIYHARMSDVQTVMQSF